MKRGKATDLSNSDGVIACSDQRCEQGRLHTINLNTVQVLQVESKRLFNLFNVNLKLCVKFIVLKLWECFFIFWCKLQNSLRKEYGSSLASQQLYSHCQQSAINRLKP